MTEPTASVTTDADAMDALLRMPDVIASPRFASTVVLIRDGDDGVDTWMMRRVQAMAFAPGAAVFPGGRVDPRDADISVPWRGSNPDAFAARFGTDPSMARELVTAALRELFEETGVLLASPLPPIDLEKARVSVESRELPLAQLLAEHGCALEAGLLHPWARWITPPQETRRYDTWFFVVTLPPGTEAASVSSEADVAGWVSAREVLAAQARGESLVLPPTRAMLGALVSAGSVATVLARAADRSMAPVHPEIRKTADGGIEVVGGGIAYLVVPPPA
jgi:8-oxo-dGTP pyrophosphatase MutT (NUDIX family)